MEVVEIVANKQKTQVRCFECKKWYASQEISRDGYSIHHKSYKLETVIVSWVPICIPCSTYWGRFKSVFVRIFGRIYSKFYLTPSLEKMTGKKLKR